MATTTTKPRLVAVVGPTASGKSELAMRIAKEFNGEIVAADSRTIYIGMDIGTAKPTEAERQEVRYWGLDLVQPGQNYSAHQFKKCAKEAIAEIQNRGKLPILVGGTGLYVDAVLFDFGFGSKPDIHHRKELEALSSDELQEIIAEKGYEVPQNYQNRRHLIRTIERQGEEGTKKPIRPDVLAVGLQPKDEELKERISVRAEKIFSYGVIEETEELLRDYGEDAIQKTGGIIYKICLRLLKGEISRETARDLFKTADWQYARRQRMWFKRNKNIKWFDTRQKAYIFLTKYL